MKKIILVVLVLALIAGALIGVPLYRAVFTPNTQIPQSNSEIPQSSAEASGANAQLGQVFELLLYKGETVTDLTNKLEESKVLKRPTDFKRVCSLMSFGPTVRPGRYLIKPGMTNRDLIGKLRIGAQDEVKVVFNKFRTKDRFAGQISKYISVDSAVFYQQLNDPSWLATFNLTTENVLTYFIPNTYFFKWTTDSKGFVERMLAEHEKWWAKNDRRAKAEKLNLSTEEVYILASIVEEESIMNDERPRIAGLYLNRLRIRMGLQADPTIKFALGRFDLKRVLFKHIDDAASSPYSTYAHAGLPPGPICIPSTNSLDAVLNAESNEYLYMCAKADLSGYHAFAKTNAQHARNAALYQAEINRRGF